MADGRFDAPRHRMKRLESWLVFIDAEPMASGLALDLHDAFTYYQVFPIPEIHSPHWLSVSLRTIGRAVPQSQFYDLGMFPASLAAEQQAVRRQPALLIRIMAVAKPA
jgi:hypothetical protein